VTPSNKCAPALQPSRWPRCLFFLFKKNDTWCNCLFLEYGCSLFLNYGTSVLQLPRTFPSDDLCPIYIKESKYLLEILSTLSSLPK
jgi:hypothetical protein